MKYYHGRCTKDHISTAQYITLWTPDRDKANPYTHNGVGQLWSITLTQDTETIDLNDEKIRDSILLSLFQDLEGGKLPPSLEYIRYADRDQLLQELNPEDIVDSAGIWDDPAFVEWFSNTRAPYDTVLLTNDGAMIIDTLSENLIFTTEGDTK